MSGATEQTGQDAGPDLHRVESLDDLATQAEAIAAPADAPGVALVQAKPDTLEPDLLQSLMLARIVSVKLIESKRGPRVAQDVAAVWDDATLAHIAAQGAEVMRRHGWTMGGVMEKWGPYIGLAMATMGPAVQTHSILTAKPRPADGQQQPA